MPLGSKRFTAKMREMSMSGKIILKRVLFDAIAFTYSLGMVAYLIFILATPSSWLPPIPDQDFFPALLPKLAMVAGVTLVATGLLATILSQFRVRTLGEVLFSPAPPTQPKSFFKSLHGWHILLMLTLTFWVSVRVTEASWYELFDREGLQGAFRLWQGLTDPNWSLLSRAVVEAIETIYIAFLATALAVPVAFLLAFFAAKNLMCSKTAFTIYAMLRLVLNVSRSVEPLVWALIFTVWVGVGPFAGMLALFVHSVASLMKYYSEVIEGISDGPMDAIRSTGANEVQVVWFGVIPQIVLPYIAMTLYRWDTNVRMATVIGLVGGGGIGTLLITYQGQAMWREVGCIIVVIAAIVWLMDTASAFIREALK